MSDISGLQSASATYTQDSDELALLQLKGEEKVPVDSHQIARIAWIASPYWKPSASKHNADFSLAKPTEEEKVTDVYEAMAPRTITRALPALSTTRELHHNVSTDLARLTLVKIPIALVLCRSYLKTR